MMKFVQSEFEMFPMTLQLAKFNDLKKNVVYIDSSIL